MLGKTAKSGPFRAIDPIDFRHRDHSEVSLAATRRHAQHRSPPTPGDHPIPLVRIAFLRDRTPVETRAVMDDLYDALRATFDGPEDDRFVPVDRHRPATSPTAPTISA